MNIVERIEQSVDWVDTFDQSFMQTWSYGEMLRSIGRNVKRFRIGSTCVQGVEYTAWPSVRYLYLPQADVSVESLRAFLSHTLTERYTFVRCEPIEQIDLLQLRDGQSYRARPTKNITSQYSWKTPLSGTADELMASFHKKTRYAIRVAQKASVRIEERKDADAFYALLSETSSRQSFAPQSKQFVDGLVISDHTRQFMACLGDELAACAIMWTQPHRWTYVLGASSTKLRSSMGASLLHWHMMQEALKNGVKEYDWWGTAPFVPKDHPNADSHKDVYWDGSHPLASIARFKVRFGGFGVSSGDAFDVALRPARYRLFALRQHVG